MLGKAIEASGGTEETWTTPCIRRATSAFAEPRRGSTKVVRATSDRAGRPAIGWRSSTTSSRSRRWARRREDLFAEKVVALDADPAALPRRRRVPEAPTSSGEVGLDLEIADRPWFSPEGTGAGLARHRTPETGGRASERHRPEGRIRQARRGSPVPTTLRAEGDRTKILNAFAGFSDKVRRSSGRCSAPARGSPGQDEQPARKLARLTARSRPAPPSECKAAPDGVDQSTTDLDRLARRASIRFQAERLALDNVVGQRSE